MHTLCYFFLILEKKVLKDSRVSRLTLKVLCALKKRNVVQVVENPTSSVSNIIKKLMNYLTDKRVLRICVFIFSFQTRERDSMVGNSTPIK